MEESVKVMLLDHEQSIKKDEILNLKPLFSPQVLRQMRLPYCISKFQPNIDVLHSCLYYLITVDKNLKESTCITFREKCLESISQYYIKNGMNFQLYQYGYVCGKILSIPIDKAMHIIYFLVYTRLASKPFINNMISQVEKKGVQLRKKTTTRSQKDISIYTRSRQSRHLTLFYDTNQIQLQDLKKQLKAIISPPAKVAKKMTKKSQNKRYFNIRKIYPEEANFKDEELKSHDEVIRSSSTSRVITIPVKVRHNQNSSIISRLKLKSQKNYSQDALKKIHVRRQKFNDWLESADKIQNLFESYQLKQNNRQQWGTSKKIIDLKSPQMNSGKTQKHPYQYYQEIANKIKSKNNQLDSIRFQCIHHNRKNLNKAFKETIRSNNFCDKGFKFGRHLIKTQSQNIEITPFQKNPIKTYRQFKQNQIANENQEFRVQKQKDYNQISKTASISKISDHGIQDHLRNIITRKNENAVIEDENFTIFNKKIKNKLKLQKYKQDYRHFLKTQIFQQFKETA